MDKIFGFIGGGVPDSNRRLDDDFSDQLSHKYTSLILVGFAIVVSTTQYVGEPINCWVPAHFTGNHEQYANDYCWVKNTYALSFDEYIPKEHEEEKRNMIPYYQWMPIILLIQALLFYFPTMVWRSISPRSGVDIRSIVEAGKTLQNTEKMDQRDVTVGFMVKQMDRFLTGQAEYQTGCTVSLKQILAKTICRLCGRRHGNFLVSSYIFVKILFIINVISQIFALNFFLGHDYNLYGFHVIQAAINNVDWTQSDRFPRVTMCDFKVRRLGNVQRYTVQCVLPINLFNEKIYLFLWFWMVLVAAALCFSLCKWIIRSVFRVDRHRYVKRHLRMMDVVRGEQDQKLASKFVDHYLKADGVFVLRILGHNTNGITVTELLAEMFDNYRKKKAEEHSRLAEINGNL